MNLELVPCFVMNCEEAGRYSVTGSRGTIQLCDAHARAMIELREQAKKELDHAPY